MQNKQTYFEQVPMHKVVEIVLKQAAAPETIPEESAALLPAQEPQAVAVILKFRQERQFQRTTMRTLVPFKSATTATWACSDCAWTFKSSGPPRGNTIDEMKQNFSRQRDEEFAAHVCANYSRMKDAER